MTDFTQRNEDICQRYMAGETLQAIGDRFRISRMRVKQIVKKAGLWRKRAEKSDRDAFLGVNVTSDVKDALRTKADERGVSMSRLTSDALDAMLKEQI